LWRAVRFSVLTKSLFKVGCGVHSAGLLIGILSHRSGIDALGCLNHYLDAIVCIAEQRHVISIPWILELGNSLQKNLLLLLVAINKAWFLLLTGHSRRTGISLLGLLHEWGIICSFTCLTFLAFCCRPRSWWRSRGITLGLVTWVIVDSLHVVSEVPVARKAIPGNSAFTPLIGAEEWLVAVSMHGMSFALMAEQASRGGETKLLAGVDLALVWLQVGVHEFAGTHRVVSNENMGVRKDRVILVIALKLLWLVGAVGLWVVLKWAVVQAIGLGSHIVIEWMFPGSIIKI
jgi:hypothetical protein